MRGDARKSQRLRSAAVPRRRVHPARLSPQRRTRRQLLRRILRCRHHGQHHLRRPLPAARDLVHHLPVRRRRIERPRHAIATRGFKAHPHARSLRNTCARNRARPARDELPGAMRGIGLDESGPVRRRRASSSSCGGWRGGTALDIVRAVGPDLRERHLEIAVSGAAAQPEIDAAGRTPSGFLSGGVGTRRPCRRPAATFVRRDHGPRVAVGRLDMGAQRVGAIGVDLPATRTLRPACRWREEQVVGLLPPVATARTESFSRG